MTIPTLETEHLILRAWRADDAEVWYNMLQEPDLLKYFPDTQPPPRHMADRYIEHHLDHWRTFGYGHWVVTTRGDGRVVGWTGLEYVSELEQTELAYLLSRSVWGRGYATEAGRAALRFAFDVPGVDAVIGLVHPDNAASIRVLEKCGMSLVDRVTLWGLEMCRYRVRRAEYEFVPWLASAAEQPAGG